MKLEHVKISDAAEVVKRVRGEKAAGRQDGSVDLVWINGENFLTMKREGLLFGPFAEQLPNYRWVDVEGKPTTRTDFSEPVAGVEDGTIATCYRKGYIMGDRLIRPALVKVALEQQPEALLGAESSASFIRDEQLLRFTHLLGKTEDIREQVDLFDHPAVPHHQVH